jgi:sporulation protein YlmC with PRC-barrel domain
MKRVIAVLSMSVVSLCAGVASAQAPTSPPVAGRAQIGVTVVQMEALVVGWSAKKHLMGKTVMNDKNDKIGKIEDLIITPSADSKVPYASFAVIGVGGFLGMGKHDVAIPMEQLKLQGTNLILPGATKDALKALPQFEYKK